MTGRASSTRERHLNGVLAFLAFAKREHGLGALPSFERDGDGAQSEQAHAAPASRSCGPS